MVLCVLTPSNLDFRLIKNISKERIFQKNFQQQQLLDKIWQRNENYFFLKGSPDNRNMKVNGVEDLGAKMEDFQWRESLKHRKS